MATISTRRAKPSSSRSSHRCHLVASIDRWTSVLGEDRVLVCFQDDLNTEPRALLDRVCRFLEVDPSGFAPGLDHLLHRRINEGRERPIPPAVADRIRAATADDIAELARRYGEVPGRWLDR